MQATSANLGPPASRPMGQVVSAGASTSSLTIVPLFHAAWLFAAGIAATKWLWLRPSMVLIAMLLTAVVCGAAAMRAQRVVWLPLATLWLLLGSWCAEMEPHPAPAPALAQLSDGLLRIVEGTVVDAGPVRTALEQNVDEPSTVAPTQRVDLRLMNAEVVTDASDAQTPLSGNVRITVRWPVDGTAGGRGSAGIAMWRADLRRRAIANARGLSRPRASEPNESSTG